MISIHYLLSGQKERRSTQSLLCDMVHMNGVNAITRKKVSGVRESSFSITRSFFVRFHRISFESTSLSSRTFIHSPLHDNPMSHDRLIVCESFRTLQTHVKAHFVYILLATKMAIYNSSAKYELVTAD